MERRSGILMHISSLPSKYGIGTFGKEAYAFADYLKSAGQTCWQLLPLGPTGYGDSPYQSFSTFAGNPYFIDLDMLREDGLLEESDYADLDWGGDPTRVDYAKIYENRFPVLRKAFQRGYPRDEAQVKEFVAENIWVPNYALFMAVKKHFDMKSWLEWPDENIRLRKPEAVAAYSELLEEDVRFYTYLQFLFFKQWNLLRDYIHQQGIEIIGDLPIYVAMDSADVWAEPEFFQLSEEKLPTEVSGVPPDYFSQDGQLWGNPLYDYDAMERDGFGWWIRRMDGVRKLFDVIRIDHFRGLESYWAVPYGDETAINGHWVKGPGMRLLEPVLGWFPEIRVIAEDLGYMTPEVKQLLKESGLPGMKVLEFAFDSREPSDYLPHTYGRNCVCYVGTHDNETVMQWKAQADKADIAYARKYLGLSSGEGFNWGIIRGGMSSVADTFVVQIQDCLGLGPEGRMNEPGTSAGNWQWRLTKGQNTEKLAKKLYQYTKIFGRI